MVMYDDCVFRHVLTRHLYYLQLRRDILEERAHCPDDQAMVLAGLALQAEYGDWHDKSRSAAPEHYIAPTILKRLGRSYVRDHLPDYHNKVSGYSDVEAEFRYMKEMMKLPEYGIHFYKVCRVSIKECKDTFHSCSWSIG